jgi:hypothetical protein
MTASFRTHGLDIVPLERHPGSLYAFDGTILIGRASPWGKGEPDGDWYARRTGKKAVRLPGQHQALAHIVGGCPDCRCDDNTCAVCVGGCPEDLCPVGEEARTR